jgi:hypothetical protein
MVFHIVLFRPRSGVSDSQRRALLEALSTAATDIPSLRRFHVGKRITHGRDYEQMMTQDFPYAAVAEFDDLAGLQAYLQHPQHEKLGALFYELLGAGLVYDYEATAAAEL